MTSRQITYEFTTKETVSSTFQTVKQNLQQSGQAAEQFSQKLSASTSESDKLKVSVRETGNEFTRLRDQANAATAQSRAGFEAQRNELRLVAEQARTTAAQVRAEQAATRNQQSSGGGGIGLPQIAGGAFLGNLASQGVQALAGGITDAAGASLTLAGNLEQSRVAFTNLLGSGQAATGMLDQIRDLANHSSFNFVPLQQYAAALLGAGEAAQRVLPDLRDIGAEVAGRGLSNQQMEQVSRAYDQVLTKGKLAGDEAMQFNEALVPVWQILAASLHKTTAEVQALSQAGQISAQMFQEAFHADAVNNFGSAIEAQSHTWNGLLSTVSDLKDTFLATFGEGIIGQLEPRIEGAMNALQNPAVISAIRQWGVEAGKFVGQLFDAAKVVASWAGLQLPEIPAAPDVSGAAADWGKVADHTRASVTYTTDFTRQINAAKNEVSRLRDGQAASSAAAQQAANDIRDAQTGVDRSYDRQLNSLKDAGTQMERNYQVAKQQRDLEQARQTLSDDTRLAGDIFSSAGQAARERLKEDRKRVTDQQETIAQDTAKFENRQAQTSVERAKQASDQRAQAQITALDRSRQAEEQATQARIRDLEATARNYETLQKALANPDKAIKQATTEYSAFYTATIPQQAQTGTQTVISTMTREYQTFYTATLPQTAAQARPLIFTALFGSGEEQKKAGADLAGNVIDGLTTAFMNSHDHNLKIIGDLIKGDLKAAWDDANADSAPVGLPAWMGGGNVAGTGAGAHDTSRPPPGKTWADGHYERGVWVPNAFPSGAPAQAPDFGPGAAGTGSGDIVPVKLVNGSYNGTYGGGRAGGGPVEAGNWYRVGESGPEWLHAGGAGRVQAQTPGGDTYIFNISGVIGNQTQVVDAINQALAQNIRQKGARF